MKFKKALATAGMYAGLALATAGIGGCALSDHYNVELDGQQPSISLVSTLLAANVKDNYTREGRNEWAWESRDVHVLDQNDVQNIKHYARYDPWYAQMRADLMQTPVSRLPQNVRKTAAYGASPTLEFLAGAAIALYAASKRK